MTDQANKAREIVTAEIERISMIHSPFEREEALRQLREVTGATLEILRRELKWREAEREKAAPQSVSLVPDEPEPAPDWQDGSQLLADLASAFRRFLVLPPDADLVVAVWVLFSHSYELFSHCPYLAITSPVKGCGKSTVLDLLNHLVANPLKAEGFSAAAIYRVIEQAQPTLLIDELDSYIKHNERMRGILNSGYQRGGKFVVCVGDDHTPKVFPTWCPKVLALIGQLPPTLDDRSIHIRMERKLPGETREGLTDTHHPTLLELKRRCIRWALDNRHGIAETTSIPNPFHNRTADRWSPVFTLARVVGGPWYARLLAAAEALEGKGERSLAVDLLSDIRDIFDAQQTPTLPAQQILTVLNFQEGKPWAEFSNGRQLTANRLARMLKDFGIRPLGRARAGTTNAVSVYGRQSFKQAWLRYLPERVHGGESDTSDTPPFVPPVGR